MQQKTLGPKKKKKFCPSFITVNETFTAEVTAGQQKRKSSPLPFLRGSHSSGRPTAKEEK
jgi:hypothetical protein